MAEKAEKVVKRRVPRDVQSALNTLRKHYKVASVTDLEKEKAKLEKRKTTMEAQKEAIEAEMQKKVEVVQADIEKLDERINQIDEKVTAANEHQEKFDRLVKFVTDDEEEE